LCVIDWRSRGMRLRAGPTSAFAAATASATRASTASGGSQPAGAATSPSSPAPFWASVRSACAVFEPSR
jgi:hypothetical protein